MKNKILILLLLLPFLSFAQFNTKIAYTAGYANPRVINNTVTTWNEARPWLEMDMREMHFLNGLQAGVRQRIGPIGLELTWHSKFNKFSAEGTDPATNRNFERKLYFRYNSYSASFENYIQNFGFGASIDANFARYRTEFTGREDRFTIGENEFGWSSHFHISLNIESTNTMTLSIKPYVQVPWSKLSSLDLHKELHPDDVNLNPDDFKESYLNFGIMLVFYNGQW